MRKKKILLFTLFFVFVTVASAQENNGFTGSAVTIEDSVRIEPAPENNGSIRGVVTTSDHKPASAVTVFLPELKKSVVADDDGKFVLHNIPAGNYHIEVSLVGYETLTQAVTIQNNETISVNLNLKLSEKQLQEVIVTSNSKFKSTRSDYASKMPLSYLENAQSYSTVTKDLIKDQVLFSVDDALRNVPGVQKMWDATGRAGDGGAYFDLRGFPVQATMRNGMASMITTTTDAANIEKVEILKGPSATLYGSALTSYGGLMNRVTKKPYDHFGGEVNVSGGSYNFFRTSADINTPIDKAKKVMFRFNGAYNTQGNFQKDVGTGNHFFAAPSLLIRPNDRLAISLDAELTYAKTAPSQFVFLYFSAADLGFDNPAQSGLDYKNAYMGDDIRMTSRSANYYATGTYKISSKFTSFTNISYSRSYSNGHNPYFFQIPNYYVTGDMNDVGTPSHYIARADQSTRNSRNNIFEAQQYFNGEFRIGSLRNRAVFGLDYTNISSDQQFYSQYNFIDVVPTNVSGFDYSTFNSAAIDHYYDTASDSEVQHYPIVSNTNIYSAFASDVLNLTNNLELIAALRLDHYNNHDKTSLATYDQTTLSPKFGLVYQPVKNQVSLFANYQNSFTNQGSYIAYDSKTDSLVSRFAKPEHANQWEVGVKTNLIRNKLTATLSYYHIKVDDVLRTDPNNPAAAQIQNGTQLSRGVELEILSNPLPGFTVMGGLSYNDFSYENTSDDIAGFRYSGAPWLANWWLNYQFQQALKGFHIGFGGNYAGKNDIQNSPTAGVFYLPAYTVLNVAVGYDAKKYSVALKMDNLANKQYWQGYTTYNPQMLRQIVASVSYKF
ncbi:MAG TPA: TonB-dependent receptor [Puia sp.]|nr:TonB-dependent receptor [Puia sp.]